MRKVHGWRRVTRWLVGIFGGLLGLVALVLLVAFIVFQTGWGRGILRNQIEARMDKAFVGGASIGSVEGNPLKDLVLNDVVINGPDKQPAITIKRLTIKLPLLPLISHELRVQKIIAEQLDVRAVKQANGEFNLSNLMNKAEPSTWNIYLPNVEVHRGHVLIDQGRDSEGKATEPIDIDNLEVMVDARIPFGGPLDANARITGQWRQRPRVTDPNSPASWPDRSVPISIGAVIHGDSDSFDIRNAGIQVGDVRAIALGVRMPKGAFAKPYAGTIAVHAPAKTVRELVPQVQLPDDITLTATARAEGRLTYFSVMGTVGKGQISAFGRGDAQAKLATFAVVAQDLDFTRLTNGNFQGHGGGFAALKVDGSTQNELPTVAGMVHAWGTTPATPPINAVIALDSYGDRVRATIGAVGSGIRAGAGAQVRKRGDVITLERGDLIASTSDVRRASGGKAPVRGSLNANLHAEGMLAPKPDLTIVGHASGRNIRVQDARAKRLAFRINASHVPEKPVGSGRVELFDVQRGDLQFSKLTVAAGNRPDGKLQVTVRSQPKPAPWQVDVDALVTTGETIVVELQRHFVRAHGGSTWTGDTGRLTIGPRKIELRDLRSSSKQGTITADATYVRAGRDKGDLVARLDAEVELGNLIKANKGHVEAHVDIKRVDNRFTGIVLAKGSGVSLNPRSPITFDGDVKIEARDKQLLANVDVTTAKSGGVKLALDVDAPKDITNARAWRSLGRDAIRTAELTLRDIKLADMAKLANAQPMTGTVDGTLELSPVKAGGSVKIRGVQVPQTKDLGAINADLRLAQAGKGELKTTLTARLVPNQNAVAAKDITKDGEARVAIEAGFTTPDRIFDPAAWKRLGPNAFRGGTVRAERLAFQPGTLERLGIVSALRGELAIGVDIEEGMKAVRFAVNVHQLRGGLFAKPIAINIVGAVDNQSTRANIAIRHEGITLVQVASEVPVTLDQLRDDPSSAKTAPIKAQARIEHVPAKTLMNVIGTSQITGGTLDGKIDIAGTVGKPTLDAKLVARGVTVPNEATRQVQNIRELTIAAKWDGTAGNVAIDGDETGGGKLRVRAAGSPDDLDKVTASIYAKQLDIAPLVAFMPGPAGGLGGQMDAQFELRGANPRTAQVAGSLHITNGRIPIAPAVGTLFKGDLKIDVKNNTFGLRMTGKLGRGDIAVAATAPLDGVTPKNGRFQVTLRKVQLIGTTEPIITGVIKADIARVGDVWRSNVYIDKMDVKVPPEKGKKLSPVGTPSDLVYGGEKIHHGKNQGRDVPAGIVKDDRGPVDFKQPSQVEAPMATRKLPTDPAIVAYVRVRNVFVESEEVRGLVGGNLRILVANNKEVGVTGNVSLARGVLDLFSRRYQVDKATLHFDG
ncbi:MAG TPA: translocation/assembly module TamB domain-containing protein, partial [Kofleriaceae bacterium]